MQRFQSVVSGICLLLMLSMSWQANAVLVKTISGKVISTRPEKNQLIVDFIHPVTGEKQEMVFLVNEHTGLADVQSLLELQKNDLVTIDYRINEQGENQADRVARAKISEPPEGLENFHGF